MKNLKIILLSSLAVLMMACGDSRKNEASNDYNASSTLGDNDTYDEGDPYENTTGDNNTGTMDDTATGNDMGGNPVGTNNRGNNNTDNYNAGTNTSTSTNNQNLTQEQYDRQRDQQMYSHLMMTQDQIDRYESSTRTSVNNWRRDNPNQTMNNQQRMELQRTNLQSILDDSQYKRYRDWTDSNPYRYE